MRAFPNPMRFNRYPFLVIFTKGVRCGYQEMPVKWARILEAPMSNTITDPLTLAHVRTLLLSAGCLPCPAGVS